MTAPAPEQPLATRTAVRVEGGLLSADLLTRATAGGSDLPGSAPGDYWLQPGERVGDAASRKWEYLKGAYRTFRTQLAALPDSTPTTTLTRQGWLLVLLRELDYGRVPHVGRLDVPGRDDDRPYRVSHRWEQHLPVHLLAWDTPLDRPTGTDRAPQPMLQELLNVSDQYLWGLLSNGRLLRVLRDSTALVGSAYVEFDLEAIFEGELYSDFLLLFALLHASRFELVAKPEKRRRGAAAAAEAEAGEEPEAEAEEAAEEEGEAEEGEEEPAAAAGALPLTPADCRIEWWRQYALETGTRARDQLRNQVERALGCLGTGFLTANQPIADALARGGRRALDEFHHELLRLAYQLIFLFVAEDRGALLDPSDRAPVREARRRYARWFSTARLRRIASRRKGDRNTDLWHGLVRVLDALGTVGGCPELALPELGGLYFRADDGKAGGRAARTSPLGSAEPLRDARLPNEHLLDAVRLLSRTRDAQGRVQPVDYRHLGAEELGSIYESLLELVPRHDAAAGTFRLDNLAGNKRKTTGSYYTPTVVIEKLLDNALDPVMDRAAASGNPRDLLGLTLVDPACGSGHVLVAAARRIARRYAVMETGEPEPSPERVRERMGDVVRHCVHGVDVNPLAAELAKVSLWLESLRPGEPLAYLDDRIKVGNALLGATPRRLAAGLPDGAFTKLTGDESSVVTGLRKDNAKERPQSDGTVQEALVEPLVRTGTAELRVRADRLAALPGRTLAEVREQARRYREFAESDELRLEKRKADAWCAAFLWRKHPEAPPALTSATLRAIERGAVLPGLPAPVDEEGLPLPETPEEREERLRAGEAELEAIVSRNRFFHWHLEFPRVFRVEDDEAADANPETGWQGGFDCVLGNPPWERVKIQEKEWFAARDERIAEASNAAERKKAIDDLRTSEHAEDREVHAGFQTALREAAGTTVMLRKSDLFPLTGVGDVNTYAVFTEKARMLLAPRGMSGLVVPTGIATDKTTAPFFADLVERRQLVTVLDMENEEKLFADVTNRVCFCLFTVCGPALRYERARLAFRARRPDQLDEREFTLDAEGFRRINPNSRTSPVCEGPEYLRVLEGIHSRVPVLWLKGGGDAGNPWGLRFQAMFHMSGDSGDFRSADDFDGWTLDGTVWVNGDKRALPLYEGKFAHHFDARFGTYEGATQAQINKGTLPRLSHSDHASANRLPLSRYWVAEELVEKKLVPEPLPSEANWTHDWLIGWRNICRSSDERTVIPSVFPRVAFGDTVPLMFPSRRLQRVHALLANLSAYVVDFAARQKISGAHLTYTYLEQLPVLPPDVYTTPVPWLGGEVPDCWIRDRVLELTYTSYELAPFARHLGDDGPPFIWDEDRRFAMRAELDAAFFHLYGVAREDVDLVLDSFRAFRNRKPDLFERTKRAIGDAYDAMAAAAESGIPYADPRLTPAPAHGPRHKPGISPLTRPAKPGTTGSADDSRTDGDALFSVADIGGNEQLDFWS